MGFVKKLKNSPSMRILRILLISIFISTVSDSKESFQVKNLLSVINAVAPSQADIWIIILISPPDGTEYAHLLIVGQKFQKAHSS